MKNLFNIPNFNGEIKRNGKLYTWWSWHPLYPYWSKSCWGGDTIEEAEESLSKPLSNSMKYYHNKLIKEENGQLVEIMDKPCLETKIWQEIYDKMNKKDEKHI